MNDSPEAFPVLASRTSENRSLVVMTHDACHLYLHLHLYLYLYLHLHLYLYLYLFVFDTCS